MWAGWDAGQLIQLKGTVSEEVRREVAESLAQSCFSQKQDPAGSKQAPYGFLFVLVVALTSCPASLWYWGKLSAASPCFLHITFCSSLVYLLSLMKVNFSAYTPWWWGDPVLGQGCALWSLWLYLDVMLATSLACQAFFTHQSFWNTHSLDFTVTR